MKFGVITDCQYADRDEWEIAPERKYRMSPGKLLESMNYFNGRDDLEFIVHLGDLIDQNIDSYSKLLEIVAHSKHAFHHVLGNHDFDSGDRVNHIKIPLQDVLHILGLTNNYYSFLREQWKFIVLDSNDYGVIEGPNDSDEFRAGEELLERLKKKNLHNAHPWNGAVSDKQLEWLTSELDEAEKTNQAVILFAHHQLLPSHRDQMLLPERIYNLFPEYTCIKAFLNGHNHEGDFAVHSDVPCITFKGMLDTNKNSYSIVELKDKKLLIKGYGREDSKEIELR